MAMHNGAVTIACPVCRTAFPVPVELVREESATTVLLRADRSELYGHLRECAEIHGHEHANEAIRQWAHGEQATLQPSRELDSVRLAQPHDVPPPVKGNRTCTMCGTRNSDCVRKLQKVRSGCCGACDGGNTHPAPQESTPCAVWAAENGAQA